MTSREMENVHVVHPEQDIVASTVDEFRGELMTLIEGGKVDLVIDLADVSMVDSIGLAVFVAVHKTVSGRGGHLVVRTANADLLRLFKVTRLDRHFTVESH